MQPPDLPFYHPPVLAQSMGQLGVAPWRQRLGAPVAELLAVRIAPVGPIGTKLLGSLEPGLG
ncbi:MAG: hypothetical protein RMJ16_02665 [Thermoguttaceae bacterium]|nr:hypothetical protein [Thermoguttaceae bacterium]